MDTLDRICGAFREEIEAADFDEGALQRQKCTELYEQLFNDLDSAQQKKLLALDCEYFTLGEKWRSDALNQGMKQGFKLAMQMVLDSLKG